MSEGLILLDFDVNWYSQQNSIRSKSRAKIGMMYSMWHCVSSIVLCVTSTKCLSSYIAHFPGGNGRTRHLLYNDSIRVSVTD